MKPIIRQPQFLRLALLPLLAAGFGLLVVLTISWYTDFSYLTPETGFEPIQINEHATEHVKGDLLEMLRLDFLTNIFPSNWN